MTTESTAQQPPTSPAAGTPPGSTPAGFGRPVGVVDTASRLSPEPEALAPSERSYRLNAVQLAWLCRDLIERYDVLRETRPVVAAQRAISEALDALAPFAELPARRTPSGGIATLRTVIDAAVIKHRSPYLAPGMVALCPDCLGQYRSTAARDEHQRAAHGEAAQ